jgi:hypothetical protein
MKGLGNKNSNQKNNDDSLGTWVFWLTVAELVVFGLGFLI